MQLYVPRLSTVIALVLVPTVAPGAQSLYAIDGVGDGATPGVLEFSGPPGGACAIPDGPLLSSFLPGAGATCPGPGVFAPPPASPPAGDVAVDMSTDTIYVTDGTPLVASYDAAILVPLDIFHIFQVTNMAAIIFFMTSLVWYQIRMGKLRRIPAVALLFWEILLPNPSK